MNIIRSLACVAFCLAAFSCSRPEQISNGNLLIEINNRLETKVNHTSPKVKPLMNEFTASEYLVCKNFEAKMFTRTGTSTVNISDQRGNGKKFLFTGMFEKDGFYAIRKNMEIRVYDSLPDMAILTLQYVNTGQREIEVRKWVNNSYSVRSNGDSPAFWSFQGSSSNERRDWILPVDSSFSYKNFMGMNNTDYGGGIPMVDLWRKDAGIAIGQVDLIPRMISLPIDKDKYDSQATMSLEYEYPVPLVFNVGDTLATYSSFVSVHTGDCYSSLQKYSKFMQASGIKLAPVEPDAYQAVWCAWGYERRFTVSEVIGTLPKVKELGLKWVDIDDGYQQAEGDWDADPDKFPGGNPDMRRMVDQIHAMGLKAKLWWAPLAVDPGAKLLSQNPDILLRNRDEVPQFISYWDAYYMSPVYYKTIDHTKAVLKMFLKDWDFDGLKMDGGFLNCVPPDYDSEHNLDYPEQSFENLPQFFEMIYNTANTYKPHAVLQICPCGACMSYFLMPWTNQTVASDPTSSSQARQKGKTYKALLGKAAYYGDHVELSDGGNDFATQVGIGAVLGTKFTWPKDNPYSREGKFLLTPEKEKIWKKWISIYNQKMLPSGKYLGDLYDIGYDKPEAHVIQKADTLYYAFYDKNWDGKVDLRGLDNKAYKVMDYVNGVDYGKLAGSGGSINVKFTRSLLLQVVPVKP
jgi:alpha-galactosidase